MISALKLFGELYNSSKSVFKSLSKKLSTSFLYLVGKVFLAFIKCVLEISLEENTFESEAFKTCQFCFILNFSQLNTFKIQLAHFGSSNALE
jgi:hypothetical protein